LGVDAQSSPSDDYTAKWKTHAAIGLLLTILRKNPSGNWVIARDANLLTPEPER
jgi:hypothetical protein